MNKAVIYARVSTEEQAKQGYSLPSQIRECKTIANNLGIETTFECVDEGISGDILERPGLNRARELVRSKEATTFICYDPDRLARKLAHQLILTEEIEKAHCHLAFVNFEWQDTPEGRLFYSLRGAISEFEKEKIRERTSRGLRQKAKQGGLTHDPKLYGYRYDHAANSLRIEPSEAQVVRLMYRYFTEKHLGYSTIASHLTRLAIPTRKRAIGWAATTVKRILTNPTYTGTLYIQRYNTVGMRGNKYRSPGERVRRTERPASHWIALAVPPIIDEVTFKRAQQQATLINRTAKRRNFHSDYLLTGLLRCGLCDSAMSGTRSHKTKYYRCNKSSRCGLPYLRADIVEPTILELILRWLNDPQAVQRVLSSPPNRDTSLVQALSDQLKTAEREKQRLIDLMQQGVVTSDEIAERLQEVRTRIKQLSSALSQQPSDNYRPREESVSQILPELTSEQQRVIIQRLIKSVTVKPNELVIHANLPCRDK